MLLNEICWVRLKTYMTVNLQEKDSAVLVHQKEKRLKRSKCERMQASDMRRAVMQDGYLLGRPRGAGDQGGPVDAASVFWAAVSA